MLNLTSSALLVRCSPFWNRCASDLKCWGYEILFSKPEVQGSIPCSSVGLFSVLKHFKASAPWQKFTLHWGLNLQHLDLLLSLLTHWTIYPDICHLHYCFSLLLFDNRLQTQSNPNHELLDHWVFWTVSWWFWVFFLVFGFKIMNLTSSALLIRCTPVSNLFLICFL